MKNDQIRYTVSRERAMCMMYNIVTVLHTGLVQDLQYLLLVLLLAAKCELALVVVSNCYIFISLCSINSCDLIQINNNNNILNQYIFQFTHIDRADCDECDSLKCFIYLLFLYAGLNHVVCVMIIDICLVTKLEVCFNQSCTN
jgi:hypothetical protein